MKRNLNLIMRLATIITVLGVGIFGGQQLLSRKQKALAKAPQYGLKPTPVLVVKASRDTLSIGRSYLAVCEPVQRAKLSARITSRVAKILCDEGTPVKAGQTLLLLDDREIHQNIAMVQAGIERIAADLTGNEAITASLAQSVAYWDRETKRNITLAQKGSISAGEAEETAEKLNEYQGKLLSARQKSQSLQHQTKGLNQERKRLEVQLSYCTIKSPYAGLVGLRLVDPGDLATPGKTLFFVLDRSQVKLSFAIPQKDLSQVRAGLDLQFTVKGKLRRGKLTRLYPTIDPNRTIRAECILSPENANDLLCGGYVPVSVVIRQLVDEILIPTTCLLEDPQGKPHVFIVKSSKLAPVPVEVIGQGEDRVAVRGIGIEDLLVANTFLGWTRLFGGMKVEPVQ